MNFTKEQLETALVGAFNMKEFLFNLGYSHVGTHTKNSVKKLCFLLSISLDSLHKSKRPNIIHKRIVSTCPVCNKEFPNTETGKSVKTTCSYACSNIFFRTGHRGANFIDGRGTYRIKAMRTLLCKCAKCGYDRYTEVLEVNHKDCNRKNNNIENLEILCPPCHNEFHFLTKTGKWKPYGV